MKTLRYNTQTETYTVHQGQYKLYNKIIGRIDPPFVQLEVIETSVPSYNSMFQYPQLSYDISIDGGEHDLTAINGTATEVWTIIDKTEEEIIEEVNQRAVEQEENIRSKAQERLIQLEREVIHSETTLMEDETAIENAELFDAYKIGHSYSKDERFYYPINGKLYKVLQAHTSALHWKPTEAVSLYVEVTPAGVIVNWKQPVGGHDAYQIGDKVKHNGKTWESTAANNVWEPGVYGWKEI